MPNKPENALERLAEKALDEAVVRLYDIDGPSHAEIASALMAVATRWARNALGPEQIVELVSRVAAEPPPKLIVTELNIPGREPLPGWCRGVVHRQS